MASAKRRFNFTNRKRISQELVDIRLSAVGFGAPLQATAELKLDGLGFPSSASVAIEAYRSSSLMRFDCGTVGNLRVPPIMTLDEVDAGGNIQFRVKVSDREQVVGRLVATASRISPRSEDDGEGRAPLLPVKFDDISPELWRVSGSDDEDEPPALVFNYKANGLESRVYTDPLVRGLVMPAAFRIVLERLVAFSVPEEDEEGDWKNRWLKFCAEELEVDGSPYTGSAEDKERWIQDCVTAFSQRAEFLQKISAEVEKQKNAN